MNADLWLKKAAEDLIVARLVWDEGHYSHTCFLSQQSIEKNLKGYLLVVNGRYPRTHRLVDLLSQCAKHDSDLSEFLSGCIVMDQYYIPTRYPDAIPGGKADGMPSKKEAKEAIAIADEIAAFIEARIDREKFLAVLAKAPDVEPEEYDRL